MILQKLNITILRPYKMKKLTYSQFNDKIYNWYNDTRPQSSKPKSHLISRFYDMYLDGQDFNFLHQAKK